MTEVIPANIKIKQEKTSPVKTDLVDTQDEIDKILESRPFSETDEKKNLEPVKTSDELLEELFGVIGANVNAEEIFNGNDKKKKKKKRKHSDEDDDDERSSKKLKKVKKEKKIKEERDSEEKLIKKIKKEKKDKDKEKEKPPEKRKLSIVIKDFKLTSTVTKPSSSSSSKDKNRSDEKKRKSRDKSEDRKKRNSDKDRSREKEKSREKSRDKRSRDKKSSSDISLSDEDTYRNYYDYHMSSRWNYPDPGREWDRDKYRDRRRDDRYYDSRRDHHHHHHRRRSRSRTRSRSRSKSRRSPIDKKRLLEIARKNAISMLKNGLLPKISTNTKEKLMAKIRHGGKTIEELTNYCKKLSRAEDLGELSDLSDSEGESLFRPFHHPFEVKDRGPIVMNIRNSIPIAPKPASELKAIMAQFPVSSGKQHQMVENAWIPVKTTNPSTSTTSTTITTTASSTKTTTTSLAKQIQEQLPELAQPKPKPLPPPPPPPLPDINPALKQPYNWKSDDHYCKDIIPALAPPPAPPCDVSDIISQRLNAMRKLQENPADDEASKILMETQQNMTAWAASKFTPGQFLGSTDVRVLSQKELAAGQQAWARKTQLIDTTPVTSGVGMHLLRKMGWTPGEGLGKEKNGSLEPLLLELKFDKRGLESNDEILRQTKGVAIPKGKKNGPRGNKAEPISLESLQQKHPVSLLGELASKRRWGAPNYVLVSEKGPAHAKNFIFKVKLNGIEYTSPSPANNKKEAKAVAARFCLKELGILP